MESFNDLLTKWQSLNAWQLLVMEKGADDTSPATSDKAPSPVNYEFRP